jgi:probable HAF family extracellular repeat protein
MSHAFVWRHARMQELGTIGGVAGQSQALGINHRGQVVGTSQTPGGAFHRFVWRNGRMTDLGVVADSGSDPGLQRAPVAGLLARPGSVRVAVRWSRRVRRVDRP